MSISFTGLIQNHEATEIVPARGPIVDTTYVGLSAKAHEYAGFDRVLIGYGSVLPDNLQTAAYALHETRRLGVLLAHRPGFVAPTLAARQLATLDHFSGGRLAVHIISGGDDTEQQRDGDFLNHDERYERTDEYLDVVKKAWLSEQPFDHEGKYYRVKGNLAKIKPLQQPHIPIYFGGSSEAAIRIAGKHADVYALYGESLASVREKVAQVRAAAALHQREQLIRFSLSLRLVLGETEDEAWTRAERILARAKAIKGHSPIYQYQPVKSESVSRQRLLAEAERGRVLDKRLWTEITAVTGAVGNSTALVGTVEQVVDSLLDYYDVGIDSFLIRGFETNEDALHYGRHVIPLLRERVAQREAAQPETRRA